MRLRKLLTAALAAALTVAVAHPASGATTGITGVSVLIEGGFLSITVPGDAGSLGTLTNSVVGGTISGHLGPVQVSDARSPAAGSFWTATVIATALTPVLGGPTIPASAIGYAAGTITKVGTATYVGNNPPDLTAVHPAVSATGITGDNSASWDPTINVWVAGGTIAGLYTGSVTHSVA